MKTFVPRVPYSHRALLPILVSASLAACAGPDRTATPTPEADVAHGDPRPPNVILVMTDDQGYGDFGIHGNPVLETPCLDAFAGECPTVERFYVSPVCAPTRASLMTGRYNYRTRVVDTWRGRAQLEPDELTLAEALGFNGYRTGIFGKWHLGDAHPLRPMDQGFDHSLIHRGGGLAQPSDPLENARRYTDPILFRNGDPVETEGYCTDVYFDEALEFIDRCQAKGAPFFAYITPNAPHDPFHDVPEELYAKYEDRDFTPLLRGEGVQVDKIARTFAMIENIDQNFGRLLAHLEALDIADSTIVIFLTDNGPLWGRQVAGLRSHKTSVYEGGIRSPLWVRWPGVLDASTRIEGITAHIDLMPTLLEATRSKLPRSVDFDGVSLWPALLEEGIGARAVADLDRRIYIQSHRGDTPIPEHHFASIGPRYKLVRASGFGSESPPGDHPFELYDLLLDPGETRDLAPEDPARVAALRADYRRWFDDVSGTRPDNYAPPRIRPGTPAETSTTLTRNDWRVDRAEWGSGWGRNGYWPLHFDAETELEVTLVFREPVEAERVSVHLGNEVLELRFQAPGDHIPLGPVAFPGGDIDLWVEVHGEAEILAPYQVVLETRGPGSTVDP